LKENDFLNEVFALGNICQEFRLPLLSLLSYLFCNRSFLMTQIPGVVEPSMVEVSFQRLCLEAYIDESPGCLSS
jgi:hypothetical protein